MIERNPLPGSRSCSPVEYVDPQSNTLLDLLRNISEEIDEFASDKSSLGGIGKRSPSISPAATLTRQLQNMAAAQQNRGPMGNTSIKVKSKTTTDAKAFANHEVKSSNDILRKQSPPLDPKGAQKIPTKSPSRTGSVVTSPDAATISAATAYRRVSQPTVLPSIQISRTESQLVMKKPGSYDAFDSPDKDGIPQYSFI